MAANAANQRVALNAFVSKGAVGATAPTNTTGLPTGFNDMGLVNEDGIEIQLPDAGDATPIKAIDGTKVRILRTPSDDVPTWHLTFMETSKIVVETFFGITLTQTASQGTFVWTGGIRIHEAYIFDYVDGANLWRDYVPYGTVTEVGAVPNSSGDGTQFEVTIAGEYSSTLLGYFARFDTSLHS